MGGSERYAWALARAQSTEHDVHIYTSTRHLDRVGTSQHDGVSIHRFYAPVTIWNINSLSLMLRSLTKSESDVFHIHSFLFTSSNQAVLAKVLKKRKALLHIHGGVGTPPYRVCWFKLAAKRLYDRTLGKFTIRNSDLIASVSRSDLKAIAKEHNIPNNRLRYIPNVVDTELFKPRETGEPDRKTLLYLGDLEPWKGIGSLIKWLRNGKWTEHEIRLRFVGQGSYLRNLLVLQEKTRKLENGISMDVLGPKNHEEIPAILNESSALILPSYWEGMPTVLLEAMASGIPVISTGVGDVPRLIKHRRTGFLIDRSFRSFREAVDSALNDNLLVRRITRKARNLIERDYSLTHVNHIANNVYSEIAS